MNTTVEKVTTQRPSASAFINIGSDDRFAKLPDGTPDYSKGFQPITNFNINLGQSVSIAQPRRFAVTQVYFPYYLPNITPFNCALTLQTVATPLPQTFFVIPANLDGTDPFAKIYTGTEIAQAVQTAVSAQAPIDFAGFQCTWNQATGAFQLFLSTAFRVIPTPPGQYATPGGGTVLIKTDLRKVMGLDVPYLYVQPPYTPLPVGPGPFQGFFTPLFGGYTTLNQTNYIDICSVRITQSQRIPDSDTNKAGGQVIVRVYVPPANGQCFTIVYEPQTPKFIAGNPDMLLSAVDIQLRNDQGGEPYFPGPLAGGVGVVPSATNPNFPTASGQEFYLSLLVSES